MSFLEKRHVYIALLLKKGVTVAKFLLPSKHIHLVCYKLDSVTTICISFLLILHCSKVECTAMSTLFSLRLVNDTETESESYIPSL